MKKRTILLAVSALIILAIAGAAVFLWMNPQYTFIAGEFLGARREHVELDVAEPNGLREYTLDELKSDDRVTFDQSMMLVNTTYTLADDYVPEVEPYGDTGVIMNVSMTEAYKSLSSAVADKTGERLLVSSDYRTAEQQKEEYESSPAVATVPGASEHQTGLALDVYVPYYASYGFLKSEAGRFVDSECWRYGFIVRYPVYGEDETGIVFEPWHIRYVGMPHAKLIYHSRSTLEGYIGSLAEGVWYSCDEYIFSRQTGGSLLLPGTFSKAVISPDNTGGYIVTLTV